MYLAFNSTLVLMILRKILFSITCFIFSFQIFAQKNFYVRGIVKDKISDTPLEFATVKLYSNNKILDGKVTLSDGSFEFSTIPGIYFLEIEFVGYLSYKSEIFKLTDVDYDLGILKISHSNNSLEELVVQGEKSTTELQLDKRVFNVGKDLANAGGSAQDILVNVPSVTVDPDGAIKLRGSSNVRILIDGKPSGMVTFKGGAGLRQLQASMIERVEVITNPSARYEAEGQGGIINIVLKKDKSQGFNGSFEVITGNPDNFGLAANVNYRKKKLNFFINYALAYRSNPYRGDMYQEVRDGDTLRILSLDNKGTVGGFDNNIRGGIEYYFSEKSVLTGSYLYSKAGGNRHTENIYKDFIGTISNPKLTTLRTQEEVEREPMSEYVLSYKRDFARKGHEINAQFRYLDHFENSDQTFTQNAKNPNGTINASNTFLQTSVNDEFEKQYLLQLDYTHPFSKNGKIEGGLRYSFRDMVNDYVVNDVNSEGKESPIDWLDNYFIYKETISGLYGIVSNKVKKISYQIGLRAEGTNINTELQKTNETNPRKYNNLFPSGHFTYALDSKNSLQLSYSRRIRRPVYNDLSPFSTLSDSRNFNSGNPNLNPEFSDVFEMGHLLNFEKASLVSSVYYRYTTNYIFGIRYVDELGLSKNRPENLNFQKAYGIDLTGNLSPYKWWKLDGNFNLFHANIDGSNIETTYTAQTVTWFARATSRFILPKKLDIQLRYNYEAAQKTAQGSRKAIGFLDFSVKKEVVNKKGAINFSILDVFNTRWMRSISEGVNFYTENNRQFRPRQINLTFSYRMKS